MPDEATNPRITLDDVPVSEAMCRSRTNEILKAQRQTHDLVVDLGRKIDTHRAWHNGKDCAKHSNQSSGRFWLQVGGAILALVTIVGGTVWALSSSIPDAQAIAKAMKETP